MEPLLSVVVPAYNAEAWVESCINSILCASVPYPEAIEVIVVNDGSTDNTQAILEDIVTRHPNVTAVRQENRGLSGARNAGLRIVRGRYIAFVDADDEWCNSISLPWKEMKEGEIELIGLDMIRRDRNGITTPYRRYLPTYHHLYAPALRFLDGRNLFPSACSYLIAKTLIDRTGLCFTEGIYHEDEEFSVRAFADARSFMAVPGPHYLYIERTDSITTNQDPQKLKKRMTDLLLILEKLQSFSDPKLLAALRCKTCFLATDTLRVLLANSKDKRLISDVKNKLKEQGLYPFPFYPNMHYLAICLYLYLRILFIR